jgi:hypothetical protein
MEYGLNNVLSTDRKDSRGYGGSGEMHIGEATAPTRGKVKKVAKV